MKLLSIALLALLSTPTASLAGLSVCPRTGRVWDTSHGQYVDNPSNRYYQPGAEEEWETRTGLDIDDYR